MSAKSRSSGTPVVSGDAVATLGELRGGRGRLPASVEQVHVVASATASSDAHILRRMIRKTGNQPIPDEVDLEDAWQRAAEHVVATHNERTDFRASSVPAR